MLEQLLYLGHHPITGNSVATSTNGPGAGAWIVVAFFILALIGLVYGLRKKKINA